MAPGYRPPSTEPKGRWARHIHAYRKAHGINATRAFELWHEGLGLAAKSRTAYLAIDKGERQPTGPEAEYLASQIGWPEEDEEEADPTHSGEAGLAKAISLLVDELQAMRQEREATEARLRAVEAELKSRRVPQGDGGSEGQYVPPVGAESGA